MLITYRYIRIYKYIDAGMPTAQKSHTAVGPTQVDGPYSVLQDKDMIHKRMKYEIKAKKGQFCQYEKWVSSQSPPRLLVQDKYKILDRIK